MRMSKVIRECRTLNALILSLLLLFTSLPRIQAAVSIPSNFTFIGTGYGHGVGLSQIGTRGQVILGKTPSEILSYYYPGTMLAQYPDNLLLRINVAHQVNTVSLQLDKNLGAFELLRGDVASGTEQTSFGRYTRDTKLIFTSLGNTVIASLTSPTAKYAALDPNTAWTVRWKSSESLITFTNGAAVNKYKYGQLTIKVIDNGALGPKLEVVNTLRLHDEYLWGIGEVPSSWPAPALEVQAIASRTFALSKSTKIRKECDCHLYSSTVDQNFVGYSKESEALYGAFWKAAVNRTTSDSATGLTVLFESKPISAFFFSSSGGKTQNVTEVWGGKFPYLVNIEDPWSQDILLNPRYAIWQRDISQESMAKAFGLTDLLRYEVKARTATGSVAKILGYSSTGKKIELTGEVFRSRVKLPSTWFDLPKEIIDELDPLEDCPIRFYDARLKSCRLL